MLGKLLVEGDAIDLPWFDPNTLNLVAEVSIKVITLIFIITTVIVIIFPTIIISTNNLNLVAEVSIKVITTTFTTVIILTLICRKSAFTIGGVDQKFVPLTVDSK